MEKKNMEKPGLPAGRSEREWNKYIPVLYLPQHLIEIVVNSQDRILKRPEAIESQLGEFLGTNFFLPISMLKH